MMLTSEFSVYPVSATVEAADGRAVLYQRARVTLRNGEVGIYDTNAGPGRIFVQVYVGRAIAGQAERYGDTFLINTEDGYRIQVPPPAGCGCGDPGKKYLWPGDYVPSRPDVVYVPEES